MSSEKTALSLMNDYELLLFILFKFHEFPQQNCPSHALHCHPPRLLL